MAIHSVIAVAGCRSRTGTNAKDGDGWGLTDQERYLPAIDVLIEPVEELGTHRYSKEVAGLVLALYETGLADLTPVVPHYYNHSAPPGIDRWLAGSASHWRARFTFAYDRDAVQIVLRICPSNGPCKGAAASGPREAPEGAITELLVWSAGQFGAPVPAGMVETWSRPLSADRYAVLVLGRACAIWYGLESAVEAQERGVPSKDPMTRAVLIDPSMSLAHYGVARRALEVGRNDVATRAFERALANQPGRFVYEAAAAAAVSSAGQWGEARKRWDALDARWPADSRFAASRVESYVKAGAPGEAKAILEELPDRFNGDPTVARLRVEIAETVGPGPDYEALVTAWEDAAPYDPEPVRRHISLRLRDGRLAEAFELLDKLEARGAATEAKQLMIALGAEIGRYEEAAKQAAVMGSDDLAQRLRLRASLERGSREPSAQLAAATDFEARLLAAKMNLARNPQRTLEDVRALLREDRFRVEALALEVRALEKLGKWEEAVKARERLQFADPAFVSGPRTVAGSTSTGSQEQASLSE